MRTASGTSPDLKRLSFNQMTCDPANLSQAIEATVRGGLDWIGVWRHKIKDAPLEQYGKQLRDAGVRVSGLCRGGMFPALTAEQRQVKIDDNLRALDEAVALGTDTLVMVCGGIPEGSRDLDGARQMVVDGLAAMVPHAKTRGVRIGIEPLHPMYAANGQEALETLLKRTVDLVVMDIELPGLDGFDVTRVIRAQPQFAALPILLVADAPDRQKLAFAMQSGATDLLARPLEAGPLGRRIRRILELAGESRARAVSTEP